jgi:hypothetical protein
MTRELQYYLHDDPDAFRLELAGSFRGEAVERVYYAWRTALSILRNRTVIVDITFLRTVDEQGRALLRLWHRTGARIVARSEVSRALAEDIVGETIPTPSASPGWWQRLRATLRRPAAAPGIAALAHQTDKQPVRSIYGLSHR